jgi:hypothetical protein
MELSGQLSAPTTLTPGKSPPVPILQEAGCAPEPVWTLWRRGKCCPCRKSSPDRLDRRYTDWGIPTPWGREILNGSLFWSESTNRPLYNLEVVQWLTTIIFLILIKCLPKVWEVTGHVIKSCGWHSDNCIPKAVVFVWKFTCKLALLAVCHVLLSSVYKCLLESFPHGKLRLF